MPAACCRTRRLRTPLMSTCATVCWWVQENDVFRFMTAANIGYGKNITTMFKSEMKNYTVVDEPEGLPSWPKND